MDRLRYQFRSPSTTSEFVVRGDSLTNRIRSVQDRTVLCSPMWVVLVKDREQIRLEVPEEAA